MTHLRPLQKTTFVLFALIISFSALSVSAAGPVPTHGGPPNVNVRDAAYPQGYPSAYGWAVGDDGHGNGQILQQNGTSWQVVKTFRGQILNSIVMATPAEGYAVGNNGIIYEYHGKDWKPTPSPTHANLRRVKVGTTGMGNIIFAVGDNQTALVRIGDSGGGGLNAGNRPADGSAWVLIHNVPGSTTLYGGEVISDGGSGFIGYTVGAQGTILRYDSATYQWTTITTSITDDISDLNLSDANNGFATTFSGGFITYSSSGWSISYPLSGTNNGILDLRHSGMRTKPNALSATAVMVGNDSTSTGFVGILRGGNWQVTNPGGPGVQLNYLTQDASGNVYAVGTGGTIVPVQ